ncbi:hypothetical protein [Sphingopyxis sp. NFH-91]|uniref:hypothetical protein n=1 Tax=Sphingopyxis sp. NFH-91 TaxID=2744457 RepID=UPI001F2E52AF|nr:hypothetical protein [Sphingopyxis sp. NFH-91]
MTKPKPTAPNANYRYEEQFVAEQGVGRDADLVWTVSDDLPEHIEVTREEIDLFHAYFGDVIDELLDDASRSGG